MEIYTLHFDGSCGPRNPGGTAAYGFVLATSCGELERGNGVIGSGPQMSNNFAEFVALEKGLNAFCRNHGTTERVHLQVFGDSQLVIKIMNRFWVASHDKLYYPAYMDALHLLSLIRKAGHRVTFDYIPRELNTVCDELSKAKQWVSAPPREKGSATLAQV